MNDGACPCGSGRTAAACCGPVLDGMPATSAEALMRSRYTAYVLGRADHLLATWHTSTRPAEVPIEPGTRWLGLEIRRAKEDGDTAVVEFVARSKFAGRAMRLHETSRFVREGGRWFYVDGDLIEPKR